MKNRERKFSDYIESQLVCIRKSIDSLPCSEQLYNIIVALISMHGSERHMAGYSKCIADYDKISEKRALGNRCGCDGRQE